MSRKMYVSLLAALYLCTITSALRLGRQQKTINWQPCPELNRQIATQRGVTITPFDCATLTVPLDYTVSNSSQLELSLFKVNATRQPAKGSVLVNFGGPGGTGAENLPVFAGEIATNVGDQWDLVSWDPRGTGKTIPFNCNSSASTGMTHNARQKRDTKTLPRANLTDYFSNGGWDTAALQAEQCYQAMNATGQYIGTTATARDMLQIVDALGEDGLLRYYGWSYGTALGSYVAAMFPDRIERIVLDGNVNPHDYQAGHYGAFLQDADKAFDAFLQECLNHRDVCSLARYTNATTTTTMLDAITAIIQPLATNASTSAQAWALYALSVAVLFRPLYYPREWPQLADTITAVLNGSVDASAAAGSSSTPAETYNLGSMAVVGIRASDALWRTDSAEDYYPQVVMQEAVSSFVIQWPAIWISARWKMNAKERYEGDFKVKTKHPILYVNGEYDPVTPLASAYNASSGFEGSVVLPHNGYGHGVFVSPSSCVANYVRAYFENGTLPENGTHCQTDLIPWSSAAGSTTNNASTSNGNNSASPPYQGSASHVNVQSGIMLAAGLMFLFSLL